MTEPVKRPTAELPPRCLTAGHVRAARGALGWSQAQLAAASGVSLRTLKTIELSADFQPAPGRPATLARLIAALLAAGATLTHTATTIGVCVTIPPTTPRGTTNE